MKSLSRDIYSWIMKFFSTWNTGIQESKIPKTTKNSFLTKTKILLEKKYFQKKFNDLESNVQICQIFVLNSVTSKSIHDI